MARTTRRQIMLSGIAALAAPLISRGAEAQQVRHIVVTRANVAQPYMGLTFDDGPHPSLTPLLLDTLAMRGVRATFFLVGRNAARYPQIVQRIAAEGHEIGNHTWSHPSLLGWSDGGVLSEIDRTSDAIAAATGSPPALFRPPYGNFTQRQAMMLYEARGMPTILWSVDTLDWQRPGSGVIAHRMVQGATPGAVILAHDIQGPTVRAVPLALDGIEARGMHGAQVSELIGYPRWRAEGLRVASR
ncbi:polysaccharide deacetylase family protein [Rhodobacterales bacterium HKCCE2091]|nr:polysaccharide deacetylase family protein [Rhodobacterales bacterium HKCCE2091]